MPPRFLIYGLIDPRNGELRYVGQSSTGFRRPRAHSQPSRLIKGSSPSLRQWVSSLTIDGLRPHIEVLEECLSSSDLDEAEVRAIGLFRKLKYRLPNIQDGGLVPRGYRLSEETRRKQSESQKRRYQNPAERQRQATNLIGRTFSMESRRKSSESNKTANAYRAMSVVDSEGKWYASISEAARVLDIPSGNIARAVRTGKTAGGFSFRIMSSNLAA